jgi:hypothetical protein
VAAHTGAALRLACLADLIVSCRGNGRDSLRWLQRLRISEFNFRCEYSAGNMYPIVVHSAFQWLSWVDWPVHIFLLLPEEISSSLSIFPFQAIPFTIFVFILFGHDLRRLDEVMLCINHRTQHTCVLLNLISME